MLRNGLTYVIKSVFVLRDGLTYVIKSVFVLRNGLVEGFIAERKEFGFSGIRVRVLDPNGILFVVC